MRGLEEAAWEAANVRLDEANGPQRKDAMQYMITCIAR